MQVITVANEKGGIGKTTTAVNLAVALGSLGHQVLVIDLDSQAHATQWLGIDVEQVPTERSSYAVLIGQTPLCDTLYATDESGVRLCAANRALVKAHTDLSHNVDGIFMLRDALQQADEAGLGVDYVVVDCPGATGPVVYNALIAADLVIAPVLAELLSVEGLGELTATVQRIKARHSPKLPPPAILINNYEGRSAADRQIQDMLRSKFGRAMLQTSISRDAPLREAFGAQESIFRYRRSARSATQFRALAQEVKERLHA
jgi:chromosome partitioning protein